MRPPKLLLFVMCLIGCTSISAQVQNFMGKVHDATTGAPLQGVTVNQKNTSQSTVTDESGEFSLERYQSGPNVLIFSYVGYVSKEVEIAGNARIEITLELLTNTLTDVVVVGYGTQKRANLTGAVSTVDAEAFNDRPITNASQALAGQVPGLWVNQVSGQPGSDAASINIRGIGTFGNSSALVLVDGIQSSLNNVNPNDIESITVLKDASSAAIYGSRAANGVILVVTKSGKKGPMKVELTSYMGRQTPTVLPKTVSNSVEMMELYNQALANEGIAPHYSQATIDEYRNGTDPLIYPNNDWINIIIRPADMHEHVLRLSGGREATQYSVSFGFLDQDGIVINDLAKRYSLNFNLNSKVGDRFDWGIRSSILKTDRNQSYYGHNSTYMIGELFRSMPYYGTYTEDGRYASTWVNAVNAQFNNPLALVNEGLNTNNPNTIVGNAYFNLEILKGLKWNVTAGANYLDNLTRYFIPEVFVYNPKSGELKNRIGNNARSLTNTYGRQLLTTVFSTLTYSKKFFNDHDLTILAGANREKFDDKNMSAYVEGFLSNSLTEINAGASNKNVSGTSSAYGVRSAFGRISYAFRDKYLFEANLRYDGSSRFSDENRWGGFPSLSAGWRVTEESFMQTQRIFSNLKVRGSWGKLGNDQIGLYTWIPTLALGSNYTYNDIVSSGVSQTALANPDISWETATKLDIGFEAGFLNGRLNIEFDYFNELREDILRNVNMPWTVGALAAPTANLASVRNRGWEFSANYTQTLNELHLSAAFNLTYVKNEVTKIPDPQIGFFTLKQGAPMNSFYMWKAIGIFQSQDEVDQSAVPVGKITAPGDIKFEDISGPDGKPDGVIDANDRQIVGKPFPTWTYGTSLSAEYKGIDIGIMLQGVADVQSYIGYDIFFPFVNGAGISTDWRTGNTWTPDNPNADLPRLLRYNAPSYNYDNNSFWLQNASFLRVKNIQLGYTFPEDLLVRTKVLSGVRLFVNAQNPFTFTRFKGLDPERSLTSVSGGQYPNIYIFTAGFSLKF